MKDLSTISYLTAALLFVFTLLAGAYPFWKKLKMAGNYSFLAGEALASGVFLGAGLMHMLGDASKDFNQAGIDYPWPSLLAGSMFLLLLLLEHLGRELYEHGDEEGRLFAFLAFAMLSIHSFLAGAALGLSISISVFMLLLIAIVAHKWAASFSLAIQLNKSSFSFKWAASLFFLFALMLPLGIITGNFALKNLQHMPLIQPVFNALAAGTFLYLGTLHGLKKGIMIEKCCNLRRFTFMIFGFAVMAVLAIWT